MRLLPEIRNLMGNYHVKSGIYHFYRNEFKQAVDFFRKAMRDQPNLNDGDLRTARYYLTQTFVSSAERLQAKGDLEGATRDLARAAEVSPDYPDIRYRLGLALEALDRPDEAIVEYREAVALNDRYETALTALAFCLLRSGKLDEAEDAFGAVLNLRIRRLREPHERGLQRLREGMAAEAEEFFLDAFRSSAFQFEEHHRAALALLKAGETERALEEIDRAIAVFPKFGDLHNYRGVALCELGRVDEGIAAFRRSIALNPDYVVAKVNLAFALLRAGLFKEAESQLETVLEQDPSQSAASAKLEELRTGRSAEVRRTVPRGGAR